MWHRQFVSLVRHRRSRIGRLRTHPYLWFFSDPRHKLPKEKN